MPTEVIKTTFQFKRGNKDDLYKVNPLLASGEPCFEIDTGDFKIGNGTDRYADLEYVGNTAIEQLQKYIGTLPEGFDSGTIIDYINATTENAVADVAYICLEDNGTIEDVIINDNSEPVPVVENAVLYTPQILTEEEQSQARENIGIPTISAADAGKFMRVSAEGKLIVESLLNAEEVSF